MFPVTECRSFTATLNHPDYFIMNINLSSRAVSSDRSPGLANALGYFWRHENPQNMGSFHISTLSNNLAHHWIPPIHDRCLFGGRWGLGLGVGGG